MAVDRLRQAGELIKARRFQDARAILVTVDHPKAKEWIARLDAMEIEDPFPATPSRPMPVRAAPKRRLPRSVALLILLILLAVGTWAALNIAEQRRVNNIMFGTALKSYDQTVQAPK